MTRSETTPATLRRGISSTEVLVAIGIVGVIVAIALPALQSAREAARRAQCQNNLRQQMMAVQMHHEAEGALPSLYNGTSLTRPLGEWDLFHTHSWRVPLLPYLEQSALYDQVDFDALATGPENEGVAKAVVPTFICPSGGDSSIMGWGLKHDRIAEGLRIDEVPETHRYYVTRSDYDAMAGIQELPDDFGPGKDFVNSVEFIHWGIWGWPVFSRDSNAPQLTTGSRLIRYRQGKLRDVTDGLSNTIAIVERTGKPTAILNGKPETAADNPEAIYPGQVGWSASNSFAWSINGDGIGVNVSNSQGIYSFHPSGANVALADASVRFLSASTDFDTLIALYGRSDGGLPDQR